MHAGPFDTCCHAASVLAVTQLTHLCHAWTLAGLALAGWHQLQMGWLASRRHVDGLLCYKLQAVQHNALHIGATYRPCQLCFRGTGSPPDDVTSWQVPPAQMLLQQSITHTIVLLLLLLLACMTVPGIGALLSLGSAPALWLLHCCSNFNAAAAHGFKDRCRRCCRFTGRFMQTKAWKAVISN
jgi:hypothetical protein